MAVPVVLVLAAGLGRRFRAAGGLGDKLQMPLKTARGTFSVLEYVLHAVQASGLAWQVVEPTHTRPLGEPGMGVSIAAGVAATPDALGWLILPADLPCIRPDTLQRTALALANHEVVVPQVQGQRGHPVGFAVRCKNDLLALRGDEGARRVIAGYTPYLLETDDLGCIWDVDTPDDLRRLEQALNSPTPGLC